MRKVTFVFIAFVLALFNSSDARAIEVGVTWFKNAAMPNNIYSSFKEHIQEKHPQVKFEEKINLKDEQEMAAAVKEFEQSKDAMLVFRSAGATYLGQNPPKIPAFGAATNHPEILGVMDDMTSPDINFTGVTYYLPYETRLGIVNEIIPGARVHTMVEKGHPASQVDDDGTVETCPKLNMECSVRHYENIDQILSDVESMRGQVDGFILGSQTLLIDNTEAIITAAQNTPVFSYSKIPVEKGAISAHVADIETQGRILAEIFEEVMIKGKPVSEVGFRTDPDPLLYLNVNSVRKLDLDVPLDILNAAEVIE